jgi:predicted ATPase/class 3 adenylate cyclase
VVAFLFTDVEGSTRLWESHGAETNRAIAVHDSILREAISTHDGHVFSTGGDAFCAAFSSVNAALEAALAAQLGLVGLAVGELPLRVRMAIHVGEAEEREGDYFGPVLNRSARLMAAGHGGQLLLSGAAAALADQHTPDRVVLVDLGEHRLKDLSTPEQIYEVRHPDLETAFPPLRTLDRVLNNLPSLVTAFHGRQEEVAEVGNLLREHRLVTITGVGGGGKTRLALQVAAEKLDLFPDGVWFINLASVTDHRLVGDTVATAVGFRPPPGESVIESLAAHLRDRTTLLLIDNCEHLIDPTAAVVSRLLAATKNTRILATSRERLGVTGERVYPIPTLPIPSESDPALLAANTAVQLFMDRASAINPSLDLTSETLVAIGNVCRRLDCIPLAIELAAARTVSLTPAQIADRLDQRFRLLTGGLRDGVPHHQTLQTTIDWSYQLLDQPDRILLERISVFRSHFDLPAAERVCSEAGLDQIEVTDGLTRLVERSLLTATPFGQEMRYVLLETIRQFGSDLLTKSGERDVVERRYAEHYLEVAERLDGQLDLDESEALDAFRVEYENLQAALLWAVDKAEVGIGMRMFAALRWYWWSRGIPSESPTWAARLLASEAQVPHKTRARALFSAGTVTYATDVCTARNYLEDAVSILRPLTDTDEEAARILARVLISLSATFWAGGDLDGAIALNEEVLELARSAGDSETEAIVRTNLALGIVWVGGDLDVAVSHARQAVAIFRHGNKPSRLADGLSTLGEVEMARQDFNDAREHFTEGAAIASRVGYLPAHIESTDNLAELFLAEGKPEAAMQTLSEILPLIVDHSAAGATHTTNILVTTAEATHQLGHHELAVRLIAAARTICDASGFQPHEELNDRMHQCETELRTLLTDQDFHDSWEKGTTTDLEQTVHDVLIVTDTGPPQAH